LKPTLYHQHNLSQWVAADIQGLSCRKYCWTRFKVCYQTSLARRIRPNTYSWRDIEKWAWPTYQEGSKKR
jgi:hypothetical protein